ncbi:MAG TPA: SGNH/GDSL hydrolase family protein [Stellaceae bacterium]|nr:SGNH/GDSL hydrolase family protein [Stellaceae bacterium]
MRAPALLAAAILAPIFARADDGALCAPPPGNLPIAAPLEHVAARLNEGAPLTIVAVGSSSTSGIGASSPELSYPSRLEVELQRRLPRHEISIVNRGKGGEDAPEELARLGRDVVAAHPDLAIWQVGTNAVLRRDDLGTDGEWMREGIDLMKKSGIDVVLMDMQYAPRVLERHSYPVMEELIANTAVEDHVGLFRRFALMRFWQSSHAADAPPMVGGDGLHMTDAGYGCLAADLAAALVANWQAETKLAQRAHAAPDSIAGLTTRPSVSAASARPARETGRNDAVPFN